MSALTRTTQTGAAGSNTVTTNAVMTLRYIGLETNRAWRNRRFLLFSVGMPVAFFFLWSGIYGSGTLSGITSKAYLMTSMASYGTLTAAVSSGARIAIERASGWNRQLRLTALPPASYFLGKVGVAMLIAIPSILLVFLAGGLVSGVHLSAATWVICFVASSR
jgi:ABC-2 type transport system permease protein